MNETGIFITKVAFYVGLAALLVILILKKRKQAHDIHRDENDTDKNK